MQYTRNMVTGASTADLAVILVDARKGVLEQSKRHAYISSLLGIPHMAVAVNKMDLVDFSEDVFDEIVREFSAFAHGLPGVARHRLPADLRASTATTSSSAPSGCRGTAACRCS